MSPKNKGKLGQEKPAVEAPDEFVSGVNEISDKLRPHVRAIAIVVGTIAVVMIGWTVYQYLGERSEAHATALYDEAISMAQRSVTPESAPENPEDKADEAADKAAEPAAEGTDEAADETPKDFTSHDARAQAVLEALGRLQAEYGSTDTAKQSRLLQASTLYDLGRYQEAADVYRAVVNEPVTPSLQWIAREGLGYAQEALAMAAKDQAARDAGLKEALETFRQLQPQDTGSHRDYALYHEGRILAELGQRAEAIAALKKALEVAPESLLTNDIKQRLAQLEASATE